MFLTPLGGLPQRPETLSILAARGGQQFWGSVMSHLAFGSTQKHLQSVGHAADLPRRGGDARAWPRRSGCGERQGERVGGEGGRGGEGKGGEGPAT